MMSGIDTRAKIYVAGHSGMVGSAIVRVLEREGFKNLVLRTSQELDLRDNEKVEKFFERNKPDYVFHAAAQVGGIWANDSFPAKFIYDNLVIETNVIHQSHLHQVKKLLLLGSSCIYPRECPQPIREEYLLTGPLEPTNEWYAIAKIAGIKLCQAYRKEYGCDFISVMPTNLYGPGDNYDLQTSHVLPALLRKIHESKITSQPPMLWGTGAPKREFLHVDDCAEACLFLLGCYSDPSIINVGVGKDISIAELANLVASIVQYKGDMTWDHAKPDGTPRKLLDCSKINNLGWFPKTSLQDGLARTYKWYQSHEKKESGPP